MKTLFKKTVSRLAEAAVLEEGVQLNAIPGALCNPLEETLEDNLIEVAFAEAADYDDIHKAILREHLRHCKAA